MTRTLAPLHWMFMALMVALALLLSADPALAQAAGEANKNFSCSGGKAVGSMYSSGLSCPTTMGFDNVFTFVVCNMEQLSSNLMGHMFCGMVSSLAPAVSAVLVLATTFFAIAFTIGLIPATAREFQMFLFKVCFVWAFATQSDYLIGIAYMFFINGIRDGVAIALSNAQAAYGFNGGPVATTGSAVYEQLDGVIASFIHYATDYMGIKSSEPINPANPNEGCKNALFAVMAIMAVAFPPIFYLALCMLGKLCLTFLRAVFGYVYALVGIAFLLTLAPFFMSFFLFRQTRSFFDKWIGYLASFALQIIILFAFLSFILSINVSNITSSFSALVVRNQETSSTASFLMPWDYCTLCEFEQVDDFGKPITTKGQGFLAKGKLQCKKFTNGVPNAAGAETKPITVFNTATPGKEQKDVQTSLLTFMTAGLMSLVILAYIVESLLGYVGSLAQSLATGLGGYSAPQLGGGQNLAGRPSVALPFEGNINDFSSGFERGYHTRTDGVDNSISATTRAFKEGASTLVSGHKNPRNQEEAESGFTRRIIGWLSDPNKFD